MDYSLLKANQYNPWPTISYLGRYLKRPPIAMSRLIHYDGKRIVFDYLNHRLNKHQTLEMDIDHFLYLFTQHIPEKNFRLIRYYGFLANRVRTDGMAQTRYTPDDKFR